jgi:hypothetical protein
VNLLVLRRKVRVALQATTTELCHFPAFPLINETDIEAQR